MKERAEKIKKLSQDLEKIGISCLCQEDTVRDHQEIILLDFAPLRCGYYSNKFDYLSIYYHKNPKFTNYQDAQYFHEKNKKPNRVKIDKLNYNAVIKLIEYELKEYNHLKSLSAIRKSDIKALLIEAKKQGTRNRYNKYNDHYYITLDLKFCSYEASIEKRSGYIQQNIKFHRSEGLSCLEIIEKIKEIQ